MAVELQPPPSAGILRNGPEDAPPPRHSPARVSPRAGGPGDRRSSQPSVTWDEDQLADLEIERQRSPRMKIEMPDTPFLYYDSRAEPDDQFKTAEPTDKVPGPDGSDAVPLHFNAESLQQRLGLVKLLQDAEQAYHEDQEQEREATQGEGGSVGGSLGSSPTQRRRKGSGDTPVVEVPAGGAADAFDAVRRLLECSPTVELRGRGKGADAAAEVWMRVVTGDAGICHRVRTGLRAGGEPELAVVFRNPYVALEVDRRSGVSVPSSAFEAKRRALYTDQAANFREMLARAHRGDDDDDDDESGNDGGDGAGQGAAGGS